VSGVTGVEQIQTGEDEWEYEEVLYPTFVDPPLHFFSLPKRCPPAVSVELTACFRLVWMDVNAAANRVRAAVERLMDHLKIPTKRKNKNGKFDRLSLHKRIEEFRKKEPVLGDALLAVKWLGNSGSHGNELRREDLFDAFKILDHVLDVVLVQRGRAVAKLAREINKRKGPRSRGRRRSW
jgi:hypothetical protein